MRRDDGTLVATATVAGMGIEAASAAANAGGRS
jgi:hypothetical protein